MLAKVMLMAYKEYFFDAISCFAETLNVGLIIIDDAGSINYTDSISVSLLNLDHCHGAKWDKVVPWLEWEKLSVPGSTLFYHFEDRDVVAECRAVNREGLYEGVIILLHNRDSCKEFCSILKNINLLNEELNNIIESSYDGIWVSDGEGVTLRVNSAYERITGFKAVGLIGKRARDLVNQGLFSLSVTEQVLHKKHRVTQINKTSTGKKILVTGNPIFDSDMNICRVVTNVRDITELSNLQRQLELLSIKNENEIMLFGVNHKLDGVIYQSKAMRNVINRVFKVSRVDSTVLITGESGVGKEVVANLIHNHSDRKEGPFIKVNCAALPESLIESELFGYEKGAFTGAKQNGKPGLFELANGGTLFLDEIAEIPMNLQVKLLRALQEQEIIRVGGTKPVKLNIRLITATNREIKELIEKELFREDLYYRINVIPLEVPPLRKRRDDIPFLINHYLQYFNKKYNVTKTFSISTLNQLTDYDWPGNVRELVNLVERLVVMSESDKILPCDLPGPFLQKGDDRTPAAMNFMNVSLKEALESLEMNMIKNALERFQSTRKAARYLGINQSTIVRKTQKYNIY